MDNLTNQPYGREFQYTGYFRDIEHPDWTHPRSSWLPLDDPVRVSHHDAKVWHHEQARALCHGRQSRVRCPCTECGGQKSLNLDQVYLHLQVHGRHPECQLWNVPHEEDSSDEEWRADLDNRVVRRRREVAENATDAGAAVDRDPHHRGSHQDGRSDVGHHVGIDVPRMIQETFQDLDAIYDEVEGQEDMANAIPEETAFDMGSGPEAEQQ
ncbi:unnamed protein product [Calypogeia fissa]